MADCFDTEDVFDEDYLYFSAERLSDEASDAEVAVLWDLARLEPGADVLDLACGHGRIANRLAARGANVTGLDVTPLFLDEARRDAAQRGVTVDYHPGDMREIPWRDRFEVVVSWFTAFGYFDDDTNRKVLAGACDALRPGGRLVIELNHKDSLLGRWQPVSMSERDGNLMIDAHEYDPLTGNNRVTRTVVRDGRVRRFSYFTRMFAFTELRDWLLGAGFTSVAGHGRDGAPLTMASPRMIAVATR